MKLKVAFTIVSVLLVLSLAALGALVYQMYAGGMMVLRGPSGDAPWRASLGRFERLETPRPVPQFTFKARSGAVVDIADYRGHVVLVNLWATWCAPCVKEMPSLARLQAELRDLAVLAISQDDRGAEVVDPFLQRVPVPGLAVFLDPTRAASRAFHIEGLPTSFLIDREGRLVGGLEGVAEWDSPRMLNLLRDYVRPRPKTG